MSWQFEKVAGPFGFTEGPVWDGVALLFSDIPSSRTLRYDPSTRECVVFREATNKANGLMLDAEGQLFACEGGGLSDPLLKDRAAAQGLAAGRCIARYDGDGARTVIADRFEGRRLNSPNDLAIDRLGRLWFTDPRYGDFRDDLELDHESVFRAEPQPDGSHKVVRVTFDTTRPNGLLLSPDLQWLYVANSQYGDGCPRELRAYPIRDDGSVGPFEVLHNFYPHRGIDGMTLDDEGHLIATAGWELSGPGPMLYVFTPKGRVLETHPVPMNRPTNVTFGDHDLRTLYLTGNDGCLWAARTEREGFPPGRPWWD